jgi:hypothetical protein
MKATEFAKIGKKLLPHLPGFTMKGKLLFVPPVGDIVRGIYFENSSGTNDFYVRALYLPLFVPQECMNFIHGDRLRWEGHELWHGDDPNLLDKLNDVIQAKAMPFLELVSTLAGVLESLKADVKRTQPKPNSHYLEEMAYVLIKIGDFSAALEIIADLKKKYRLSTTPYIIEQRNRLELIEDKLRQSPEAALAQLEVWRVGSIEKLKLEQYT